jgi:hypothetical protein
MEPDLSVTSSAVRIAARRCLTRADDAASGADGEWRNTFIRDAFVATCRQFEFTTDRPGRVTATGPATSTGRDWHYIGRESLAYAARHLNLAEATVTGGPDIHTYILTFTA